MLLTNADDYVEARKGVARGVWLCCCLQKISNNPNISNCLFFRFIGLICLDDDWFENNAAGDNLNETSVYPVGGDCKIAWRSFFCQVMTLIRDILTPPMMHLTCVDDKMYGLIQILKQHCCLAEVCDLNYTNEDLLPPMGMLLKGTSSLCSPITTILLLSLWLLLVLVDEVEPFLKDSR